jgi:hypothetical protein
VKSPDALYPQGMAESRVDEVQQILDRHARRVARELGGLLVDLGEALRKQGAPESPGASPEASRHETKDDLFREAERLGIKGRSRMSKDELRGAIDQLK